MLGLQVGIVSGPGVVVLKRFSTTWTCKLVFAPKKPPFSLKWAGSSYRYDTRVEMFVRDEQSSLFGLLKKRFNDIDT
jgi:hypothetical protein